MDYYGEHLGIDKEDISGWLTFSTTVIKLDKEKLFAVFKLYRPYYYKLENLVEDINKALAPEGINVLHSECSPGVMHDPNSPLIQALSHVYAEHTGHDSRPRAVGGTYSKYVSTICGFGAIFPNTKDYCHVVDERIRIDELVLLGKIYADAIYELANIEKF
jgi:succinyl-diaminopimelate desuccinylase